MDWLTSPEIWASLVTLTALESVLGIDNLVFIAILAGRLPPAACRLPPDRQAGARRMGQRRPATSHPLGCRRRPGWRVRRICTG